MSRQIWSLTAPLLLTAMALLATFAFIDSSVVKWGVVTGLSLALIQSFISTGSLWWAWNKKSFYWVWGGGMLARLVILGFTAWLVYQFTALSLVATLITMVMATTFFLVVESTIFFGRK